jgi:hypothetical protein
VRLEQRVAELLNETMTMVEPEQLERAVDEVEKLQEEAEVLFTKCVPACLTHACSPSPPPTPTHPRTRTHTATGVAWGVYGAP